MKTAPSWLTWLACLVFVARVGAAPSGQATPNTQATPNVQVAPNAQAKPSVSATPNVPAPLKNPLPAKTVKPNFTIPAEQYAAELHRAIGQLDIWQKSAPPKLPVLRGLFPTTDERRIKRADGATQTASGAQWDRFLDGIADGSNTQRVKKSEVQSLRQMLAQRLLELQRWMKASEYQPAAAQSIVSTLSDEGEIQTGPTALQSWWQSVKDAVSNFFSNLFKRSTTAATPSKPLDINQKWVEWLFISCVLCLLGAIGWYLWKTFGGKWVRNARREVRFVGEDAELLQLPPEELLSRAGQLARRGDFAGALRHRYIGVLVTLDERGVWRYDTRRTNWEHIAALRKTPRWQPITGALSDLTRRFDRVRYGNAAVNQTDWTRFDSDSEGLEKSVAQPSTTSSNTSSTGSSSAGNATTGARA